MAERWCEKPLRELSREGAGPHSQKGAADALRHLSSLSPHHRNVIVAAGALPILINALAIDDGQPTDEELADKNLSQRKEAEERAAAAAERRAAHESVAATLRNLSIDREHQSQAVDSGILPVLVDRMTSKSVIVQEHAAGTLMNIATAGLKFRNVLVENGVVEGMVYLLLNGTRNVMEEAAGCIRCLAAGGPQIKQAIIDGGALPALVKLTHPGTPYSDFYQLIDCNASGGINRGELNRGLEALGFVCDKAALRVMWNELDADHSGDITWEELIGKCKEVEELGDKATGPIPAFIAFLKDRFDASEVQKEAAGALKNLASGSPEVQVAAIDEGVIPNLVELLQSAPPEVTAQAEVALRHLATPFGPYVVGTLVEGSPEAQDEILSQMTKVAGLSVRHRQAIFAAGVLPPLMQVMAMSRDTAKVNSTEALRVLLLDCPEHQDALVELEDALDILLGVLKKGPLVPQATTVQIMAMLVERGFIAELIKVEAVKPMIDVIQSEQSSVASKLTLIRTFMLFTVAREHRKECLKLDVGEALTKLLEHSDEEIQALAQKCIEEMGD